MSIYPPPSEVNTIFNTVDWEQTLTDSGLSTSFLDANYLQYSTAQGNETFSNTINTGYSDVDGSTICNTFNTYSTPTTTSLFDTTDNASQVIQLGIGQTSAGTINLGRQYDGLAVYNTNRVGNWTTLGGPTVGSSLPTLNYITTTGNALICGSQTTGALYLGTNASRSGQINIGTLSSVINNIGASGSTVNLAGNTILSTVSSSISQTNGTVYMTVDTTITYSSVYNELNIVNAGTATRSLFLPSTIKNFTFWITTLTNSLIIGVVGESKFINFGCDSTDYLTIKAGSTVCIVACVGSDSYNLIYSNSTMYRPLLLYPTASSYAPSSLQSGYVYSSSTTSVAVPAAQTGGRSLNITIPLVAGVYFAVLSLRLKTTVSSVLTIPINYITLNTTINTFDTTINDIAQGGGGGTGSATIPVSTFFELNVCGYFNLSTATSLNCFGRSNGASTNGSGYTFEIETSIIKIV